MPHKRRLFLGLILGAVGCVIPNEVNAWPPDEEPLFGNANGSHPKNSLYLPLISGLDVVAICLAEQVKAPEDRQRTLNCLGLLVSNALAKTSHLENTGLLRLSLRFLGSNLGETLNLCRAIKQRQVKKFFKTLSKRDVAAFSTKFVLATLPVTLKLAEIIEKKIHSQPKPMESTQFCEDPNSSNDPVAIKKPSLSQRIVSLRCPAIDWSDIERWLQANTSTHLQTKYDGAKISSVFLPINEIENTPHTDLKVLLELAGVETTNCQEVQTILDRISRNAKNHFPTAYYVEVSPPLFSCGCQGYCYLDQDKRLITPPPIPD